MNRVETFLKDISFYSKYTILEEGRDGEEIAKVADRARLKLPAQDLAIFKCVYGFVDRMNLNGCTLPRGEVEKSLGTLVGKAVDFDHLRKRVVGHWIDAGLSGDKIIAYGVFYKGNFDDDYAEIKEMMDKDVLSISFEAWGNREFTGSKEYNLRDIEFAGGALLIKTTPAFPGSNVLEMSKNRVMEFAKVMTAPDNYIHTGKEKVEDKGDKKVDEKLTNLLEKAKALGIDVSNVKMEDIEAAIQSLTSLINPDSGTRKVKCRDCGLTFKTRELAKSTKCTSCGGIVDLLSDEGKTKSEEAEMEELKKEIASLKGQIEVKDKELATKTEELEKATAIVEELKKESEEAKVKIEEIEKAKAEEIEKAKEDAVKEAARKAELGDFATDIDVLDEAAYELAKMKKEIAEKDAKIEELEKSGDKTPKDLDKGSKNKDEGSDLDKKANKVQEYAWKKEE